MVVGSAIGEVTDVVSEGGEGKAAGDGDGAGAVGFGGGAVEERMEADTRLSRASAPKTAGPRLRNS